MKCFPKIKIIFIIAFFICLGASINKAEAGASIFSISPQPDDKTCIGSNTVVVTVSQNCQKSAGANIDNGSCSGGAQGSNTFTCTGAEGQRTITVGCYEETGKDQWGNPVIGFTPTDSRTLIFDGGNPVVHSMTLAAKEGEGSITLDPIHSDSRKITGKITIKVAATDNGADVGCGGKKVKIMIGAANMEPGTHAPLSCSSYELLTYVSPNPKSEPFEWLWNTESVPDNRYYCLKAVALDKWGHEGSFEMEIVVNNKCDKDNDGFITPEKFTPGCQNVVCNPSDWLCLSYADCNDDPDKGGVYSRPYSDASKMDYAEGLYASPTFYFPTCPTPGGCPTCDDGIDNDCDGSIDMGDSYCDETCDKDGDNYFNSKCLRQEHWTAKGDCNDDDSQMNYGFKESFDNKNCVAINCCMDGKDNDCDGKIDNCDFKKNCDKDNDRYLAKECTPDSPGAPPEGFLGWKDCDDNDPNVRPGKKETEYVQGCDGTKDNNCDKLEDKNDLDCIALCDKDGDGFFNFYDKNYKNLAGHNENEIAICGGRFDAEQPPELFSARENGTGNLLPGTYSYRATFATPQGETLGSQEVKTTIASSAAGNKKILLENIPTGNPNTITARNIYRTTGSSSNYKLLVTIPNNTDRTYEDNNPDSNLQNRSIPSGNHTGQSNITTGGLGFDTMDVPDPNHSDVNPAEINSGVKEKGWVYDKKIDTNGNDTVTDSAPPAGIKIFGGLVPCGRGYDDPGTGGTNESNPCTICHLFYILERIITLVRNLAFIVAPIIIVICGIMFITASGNVNLITKAKQGMIAVAIGIVIILSAWVVITLLFKTVGTTGGHWYEIQCQ